MDSYEYHYPRVLLYLIEFLSLFTFGTGNFVTDIIHNVTEVDCVILNSGTLRSDTIHPPGKFKMKVHIPYLMLVVY